jgi:hypothetical protein
MKKIGVILLFVFALGNLLFAVSLPKAGYQNKEEEDILNPEFILEVTEKNDTILILGEREGGSGQGEPQAPIGDVVLPLLLLAATYSGYKLYKKKKVGL